jgi:hypothetical protein
MLIKTTLITMAAIVIGILNGCGGVPVQEEQLKFESRKYGVKLADDKPEFAEFWLDSLGKGRNWPSAMLGDNLKQAYRKESNDGWINYYPAGQSDARTRFKFEDNHIIICSKAAQDNAVEPFIMKFNLKGPSPAV